MPLPCSESVVYDSEPEREIIRKTERIKRRHARKELTASYEQKKGASKRSGSRQEVLGPTTLLSSIAQPVSAPDGTIGPPDSPPSLRISHYALASSRSRSTSVTSSLGPSKPLKRKNSAVPRAENIPPPLSTFEVEQLDHCVSCGAPWTVKKTASQKLYHVQRCAKKQGLSLQAIRVLISKVSIGELTKSNSVEQDSAQRKSLMDYVVGKKKPSTKRRKVSQAKPFLLDAEQAQTVLRNKAQVIFTLEEDLVEKSLEPLPTTQVFATSGLAQRFIETTTKSITNQGQLISDQQLSAWTVDNFPNNLDLDQVSHGSPTSQDHESIEGFRLPKQSSLDLAAGGPDDDTGNGKTREISVKSGSIDELNDQFSNMNFENGSWCLHYSQPYVPNLSTKSHTPGVDYWCRTSNISNAILHHMPASPTGNSHSTLLTSGSGLNHRSPSSSSSDSSLRALHLTSTRTRKFTKKATSTIKVPKTTKRSSLGRPQNSLTKTLRSAKENTTQKKKAAGEDGDGDDEPMKLKRSRMKKVADTSWHDTLRAALLEDRDLYSKILRYEPLPLGLILQKVDLLNVSEKTLQNEVKKFLDQECISFYDADLQRGRNRKRA